MMKKNLRIVMMACLMILSGTSVAQKTILMPQQAFENLAAWLTANDYVATSSKKQYSKGYVVSYDYAVPARKAKPIETYNQALLASNKIAYSSMIKKKGFDSDTQERIAYGEKNSQSITFGAHKERNYNLQYFRDPKDSTMRYVYTLVWYSSNDESNSWRARKDGDEELIKGSVYLFYGRDPAWERAHRVTGRATIINPDGTIAEVDDLKGLEADLNSLADGLSSMVVSSSDGVDSVVVNGQTVKYWKNLAKKYSANEPEPKTSAEFLTLLNNLRAAFKNAKDQYRWGFQSQLRRNLQTGIANKIIRLCKGHGSLLNAEERKFCANALSKMKKDTDDDYLQSLLDLTARSMSR